MALDYSEFIQNYFLLSVIKLNQLLWKVQFQMTLKDQFKDGKRFGKIRGLTLKMNNKQNIEFAKELISIKLNIK